MLENYKNTIAEINRLELEPKTDEIEEKLQELNLLADYFASKITTIRSENGHEIKYTVKEIQGTDYPNHYLFATLYKLRSLDQ